MMAALLSGGAVHERLARIRETSSLEMVSLSTSPGGAEGGGRGSVPTSSSHRDVLRACIRLSTIVSLGYL